MGENPFEELKQFLFDVFEHAFLMKKHHFKDIPKEISCILRQAACTIQRYVEAKNYAAGAA